MENIFSFPKLVQHMKMEIPNNIKIGQMENHILSEVPQSLMKRVIPQLKRQFLEDHKHILNTQEKIDHVQMVLDKILMQKYNFAKQNIEEGEKFNEFYSDPENEIELPKQERNYKCVHCNRSFKANSSLHSHYRSCQNKIADEKLDENDFIQEQEDVENQKPRGFQPLKPKGPKQGDKKQHRVFAPEVIKNNNQKKKEEESKKEEANGKRQRPSSSCSLGCDIFFEE